MGEGGKESTVFFDSGGVTGLVRDPDELGEFGALSLEVWERRKPRDHVRCKESGEVAR